MSQEVLEYYDLVIIDRDIISFLRAFEKDRELKEAILKKQIPETMISRAKQKIAEYEKEINLLNLGLKRDIHVCFYQEEWAPYKKLMKGNFEILKREENNGRSMTVRFYKKRSHNNNGSVE